MDVGGVKLASHNLRDFLRIKEEDHRRGFNQSTSSNGGGGRSNSSGLTLLAVLGEKRGPPPPADEPRRSVQSTRTLLDIIREDQISGRGGGGRRDDRSSWRHLRDKIRLRHRGSGSALSSTVAMTSSDVAFTNTHPGESSQGGIPAASDVRVPILHGDARREEIERTSGRFERTSPPTRRRLISEVEEERSGDAVEEEEDGDEAEQPVRTSLMALLAENDWPMGSEGSAHMMPEDEEEVGVLEDEEDGGGVGYKNCCVCMVRHKGAAFIPCGHTFCRLCSRELWVQRGNCPLCNNHISEILDIF